MAKFLRRFAGGKDNATASANAYARPPESNFLPALGQSADVRLALLGRIATLYPALSPQSYAALYAYTVQGMGAMALDEVLKIRLSLSSALRDAGFVPPKRAEEITRTLEREVSEPLLRACTKVSDSDLQAILNAHPDGNPETWVVRDLTQRMLSSGDNTGQKTVLSVIRDEQGAQAIVRLARETPEWQADSGQIMPMPATMADELADFSEAAVQDVLKRQGGFDEDSIKDIVSVFRRRLSRMHEHALTGGNAAALIGVYIEGGRLDDNAIGDAVALRDSEFVLEALAHMVEAPRADLEKIFQTGAARPIVALCWKAGLSMRTALLLQQYLGKIQPSRLIYPKEGTDYPLTQAEIDWQLDFLGLKRHGVGAS